uniref:Pectinesterase n=1 Tax=Nelumbo nucifera TaxID=4432 RepID=A0A822Z4K9_NELNU|nr:TPA_asm: hypothetical protein HUJ06_008990 [Nelumbo nucifera]
MFIIFIHDDDDLVWFGHKTQLHMIVDQLEVKLWLFASQATKLHSIIAVSLEIRILYMITKPFTTSTIASYKGLWTSSSDMEDPYMSTSSVYYGEYKRSGPGANLNDGKSGCAWAKILTDEEAKPFLGTYYVDGNTWILSPP